MRSRFGSPWVTLGGMVVAALLLSRPAASRGAEAAWTRLEPGLEIGTFRDRGETDEGAPTIQVLRVDPSRFRLRLLNASAPGQGVSLTAKEWSARNGLVAAINASMYQEDYKTSVSLMKTTGHTNNGRVSRDSTILVFDPRVAGVPDVQIVDRQCDDFEALRPKYATLVQSIRMLSCKGENVWSQQPRRSSVAAIGTDDAGRVLLIHSGAPLSTHDLVEALRRLPIGLRRCMYAEGGSESQLYVKAGGREMEFAGAYGSGVALSEDPVRAVRIPNVIGVARRDAAAAPGPSSP